MKDRGRNILRKEYFIIIENRGRTLEGLTSSGSTVARRFSKLNRNPERENLGRFRYSYFNICESPSISKHNLVLLPHPKLRLSSDNDEYRESVELPVLTESD